MQNAMLWLQLTLKRINKSVCIIRGCLCCMGGAGAQNICHTLAVNLNQLPVAASKPSHCGVGSSGTPSLAQSQSSTSGVDKYYGVWGQTSLQQIDCPAACSHFFNQ